MLYWLKVVDEDGVIVPQGQEGNLAIRVKPHRPFSLFTEYTVLLSYDVTKLHCSVYHPNQLN